MEHNEEDWSIECSDDEKYETDGKNEWTLKPDDVLTLIEALEANNRALELDWRCPGRRGPSPVPSSNRQQDNDSQEYKTEEDHLFNEQHDRTFLLRSILFLVETHQSRRSMSSLEKQTKSSDTADSR
ncbi:PTIP binding protein Pa1 isoform X2 [Bombus fervidus]|uniref:PTIP binding protein Pa1 isoform X2 n=1 Tax=Bombus fervidus TaxID=203811 RepID=UPI003D18AE43